MPQVFVLLEITIFLTLQVTFSNSKNLLTKFYDITLFLLKFSPQY